MILLRGFLALFFLTITIYTGLVVHGEGWGLVPIFFDQIAAVGWAGQFNLDFLGYLTLSALWIAWRHRFSALGIGLGLAASVGGAMFLMPYLLVASVRAGLDLRALLLGEQAKAPA